MSGSLNRVELIGHLGADPEIRRTQDGRPVVTLRMATSESWTDKTSGEKREATEWHRIVCFNENLATVLEKYTKKGSKIFVEGQLRTRKWQDTSGQDRYTTEIVLSGFNGKILLLDRAERAPPPDESAYGTRSDPPAGEAAARPVGGMGQKFNEAMDDEIPF